MGAQPVMKLIKIGKILGAHGIKGALKVRSYAENPTDIASYSPLVDESGETYKIKKLLATNGDVLILEVAGVEDRTKAETLKGTDLMVEREKLPSVAEDEFYFSDILGFEAFDNAGKLLGKVGEVANFGASDVLEIEMHEKKSIMIPTFAILEVLEPEKKIIVDGNYVVL